MYGLAEATLAVTFPEVGAGPLVEHIDRRHLVGAPEAGGEGAAVLCDSESAHATPSVSVGRPLRSTEVAITTADGVRLRDRQIGEIRVRGPAVMKGYYNNPVATRRAIHEHWLLTGDLGYIADGNVFITGRQKDLIIKHGRNDYPHDFESAASEVAGVRKSGGRSGGGWRCRGNALLVVSLAWAASGTTVVADGAARFADVATMRMAFLHLQLSRLAMPRLVRLVAVVGAVTYILRHAASGSRAHALVVGALLNLGAIAYVIPMVRERRDMFTLVMPIVAFGLASDVLDGVFWLDGGSHVPAYLGAVDGVRLRMLRLARVAGLALPLLAVFYDELYTWARRPPGSARWAWSAMVVGAIGMPITLTAAALGHVGIKYLLAVPADAMVFATITAAWLGGTTGAAIERGAWSLLAVAMVAGLLIGGYAFDGPLSAPSGHASYDALARRVARMAHVGCIALGVLGLQLSRELARPRQLIASGSIAAAAADPEVSR